MNEGKQKNEIKAGNHEAKLWTYYISSCFPCYNQLYMLINEVKYSVI